MKVVKKPISFDYIINITICTKHIILELRIIYIYIYIYIEKYLSEKFSFDWMATIAHFKQMWLFLLRSSDIRWVHWIFSLRFYHILTWVKNRNNVILKPYATIMYFCFEQFLFVFHSSTIWLRSRVLIYEGCHHT